MGFSKNQSAGYLANHMARLFASGLHRRIQPLGLAPAQFMVLLELWQNSGLTQRDLIARLDVEQATMANTLARMKRDGLIRLVPDDQDRRIKRILPTEKALALRADAQHHAQAQNAAALAALTPDEQTRLLTLMARVIDTMKTSQN